jgi:alanine racemase
MDLVIADVTGLPEDAIRPATRAEFFGAEVAIDDFAARSGTIGYQVRTSLGALPAGLRPRSTGTDVEGT